MPTASQLGQAQHDADQLQVRYAGVAIGVGSYVLIPNTTANGKVLNLAGIMAGSSLILMSFSAIKEAPKDKREHLTRNAKKFNKLKNVSNLVDNLCIVSHLFVICILFKTIANDHVLENVLNA